MNGSPRLDVVSLFFLLIFAVYNNGTLMRSGSAHSITRQTNTDSVSILNAAPTLTVFVPVTPIYQACLSNVSLPLHTCPHNAHLLFRRTLPPHTHRHFLQWHPHNISSLAGSKTHFYVSQCFSTNCLAANATSVDHLPDMKPN